VSLAFLGLGSNVGDRLEHLRGAVAALAARDVRFVRSSSVYETEPVGLVPDQPDFYNACIEVETELWPEDLLAACKAIEAQLGRDPGGVRHGPRAIDVDLLLLDDRRYSSERLTLPHPTIRERRFVLVPLLELDPALALPDGTQLRQALEALGPGQAVRKVAPPLIDR
jgi:2-amino-4-hydroxy-6-hydroxymethyldihydropteridine diphosphokinase